ncbi:NAD(P)-binding protein [Bimuria novae-zelandiae CBS 107.79]|uniref:NAD(P)-binding protein n=1 Tax=Bimuria novae-zelandiae CBS 107.79 TaxID=1447943 RepID=A0A6A5UMY2_9PLEO|nr:NAD(P)-binding protein [Bimuria novae-zelandiae CBS 107.79]
MRIFVTGASGFVGKAIVQELLSAGHTVLALARSDDAAKTLTTLGAEVHKGSLADLEALKECAAASDAVIHLAFIHDFANYAAAVETDKAAIGALASGLEGSDRPLIMTSGTMLLPYGRVGTEDDAHEPQPGPLSVRGQSEEFAKRLAKERNIRVAVMRLAPVVHGDGDKMFIPILISTAREKGVSAYVGEGANRWPAVHLQDAAVAYRLTVERKVAAGSILHAIAEGGVHMKDIAAVIGQKLGVPVVSIREDKAAEHFGWIGFVVGIDNLVSSEQTKKVLAWTPVHRELLDDMRNGKYFTE